MTTTNDKVPEAADVAAWLEEHPADPACAFCEGRGSHAAPLGRGESLCMCRLGFVGAHPFPTHGPAAVVGAVEVRDNFLDGGYFVRCRGCSLPARVTDDTGNCPHCGWAYVGAQRCTREEYRASRADDAVLPPRPQ